MNPDVDDKLIVCSVVENGTAVIQAWSVSSLTDNLRRQRRTWREQFLPVAAFHADVSTLIETMELDTLPAEVSLRFASAWLRLAVIEADAQPAVFAHYRIIGPSSSLPLYTAWAREAAALSRECYAGH